MSDNRLYVEAAKAIAGADKITLACHVGPDGDALGSMLALGLAAEEAGKKAVASFGTPFTVPGNLAFLPLDLLVPPQDVEKSPKVMVVLDAGSAERLGELSATAEGASTLVVLDHHVTNEGFGDIPIVDITAAATGEIVFELLSELGWPITQQIATCLLTALVTDTGRFQYANTTPTTHRIAAELIAAGADSVRIGQHVYEASPFGYLKAAAVALGRVELDVDAGVVYTTISQQDLDEANIDWGDIDPLIDTIRLAVEADVAVLAKIHDDGSVKLSLRSRGATDVGSMAASMGGGGHRLAAGFTTHEEADVVIRRVVDQVEDYR